MVKDVFVIATDTDFDNPVEKDLHNLKIRLRIQEEWVAKTKADIERVEAMLENENNK